MAPGRRWWVIPAITAVVLAAAAGAGFELRDLQGAAGTDRAGSTAGTASAAVVAQPGSKTVAFAEDVAAHPAADQVRKLLQDYFDAINNGDYQLWSSTVTAARARDTGRNSFRDQYRSTLDSAVLVHRVEPQPGGGLVVLLSFTSMQNPVDAPHDLPVRCLRWQVSYPLIDEVNGLRLSLASPSASLRTPC